MNSPRLALGKSGHGGNTALVVVVSGHPDPSVKSPISSPRVLYEPVVTSGSIVSPSSGQNSVVQLRSGAIWLVVDSAAVELERRVRSIDGNTGWSSVNLHLEVLLVSLVNVGVSAKSGSTVLGVVNASSVLSSVWVAGLSVDSLVVDDVLHSLSHESSIASLVSLIV